MKVETEIVIKLVIILGSKITLVQNGVVWGHWVTEVTENSISR